MKHPTFVRVAPVAAVLSLALGGQPAGQTPVAAPVQIPNIAGKVLTVAGPIDPADVGHTLMHEHVFIDLNAPSRDSEQWRWADTFPPGGATALRIYDEPVTHENLDLIRQGYPNRDNALLLDEKMAVAELNEYKRRGGRTVVDVTSIGLRRDPLALRRVAEATGLQIVMGASWYQKAFHPPDMDQRTVESLADEIVRDIAVGVGNTGIRAGIIGEVGTIGGPLTPNEIKVIKASGRASRATGAAVTLHTSALLKEQPKILDLLAGEGADLKRVIVGHSNPIANDLPFMKQLLDRGAYIQFDTLGRVGYRPGSRLDDGSVARGVVELIKAGYGDRILLSQDVCTKLHLKAFAGTGYSYIVEQFLPHLRQLGVTEQQIEQIMVKNPQRALTFVAPQPPAARATH